MTKEELENYEPKGQLEGFPKEIITRMLECQEEQGNKKDVTVFEERIQVAQDKKGFSWDKTKEGYWFWKEVIREENFDLFFERYLQRDNQQDYSQEFRVGDKVYDIMHKSIGVVTEIIEGNATYHLDVRLENAYTESYTKDGKCSYYFKTPQLLHYRDDYDYSVIDFNNLPKRQEHKKWRAENGRLYYFVDFKTKNCSFSNETKDNYVSFDNDNYNSGNYFRTEAEAEIIAQKLNSYFKQLIQEEHERN